MSGQGIGVRDDAALWIAALLRHFPELAEELVPGRTDSPGRPSNRRGDAARWDALLRQERHEALLALRDHKVAPLGHGAAPLRIHISDTIRDITDGVVELEEAVHARLALQRPGRARVPERLRRLATLLDRVAEDPVLARHVRDEARRMARRCARALGDSEPVVRVTGRCPWCGSVSLRALPDHRTVLCVNPGCRCSDKLCGCVDDPSYRHVWPEGEWDALTAAAGCDRGELEDAMTGTPEGDRR